jgi:transcriptional regulator with XRE-family HTH domain
MIIRIIKIIDKQNFNKMALKEYYDGLKTKPAPADDFRKKIADACGVSEKSVYRWLSGEIIPDKLKRKAIASVAGVGEEELFPTQIND